MSASTHDAIKKLTIFLQECVYLKNTISRGSSLCGSVYYSVLPMFALSQEPRIILAFNRLMTWALSFSFIEHALNLKTVSHLGHSRKCTNSWHTFAGERYLLATV